jgi:hypothetical protein
MICSITTGPSTRYFFLRWQTTNEFLLRETDRLSALHAKMGDSDAAIDVLHARQSNRWWRASANIKPKRVQSVLWVENDNPAELTNSARWGVLAALADCHKVLSFGIPCLDPGKLQWQEDVATCEYRHPLFPRPLLLTKLFLSRGAPITVLTTTRLLLDVPNATETQNIVRLKYGAGVVPSGLPHRTEVIFSKGSTQYFDVISLDLARTPMPLEQFSLESFVGNATLEPGWISNGVQYAKVGTNILTVHASQELERLRATSARSWFYRLAGAILLALAVTAIVLRALTRQRVLGGTATSQG